MYAEGATYDIRALSDRGAQYSGVASRLDHVHISQKRVSGVSTDEAQATSGATDAAESEEFRPQRLVIRVTIPREGSSPEPSTQPLNKRAIAIAIAVGAIAVTALVWIVAGVFNDDTASTSATSVASNEVGSQSSPPQQDVTVPSGSAPIAEPVEERPDPPPLSPVNEVIPEVPQSALQTIRGTVRVAIRVVIGQDGTVRSARSEIPGPSRYFERISLQTAKEWTFTPTIREVDREMLVRFFFRRDGVEARAEPIDTVAE